MQASQKWICSWPSLDLNLTEFHSQCSWAQLQDILKIGASKNGSYLSIFNSRFNGSFALALAFQQIKNIDKHIRIAADE